MPHTQYQLSPDVWLDSRRAVWFPVQRALAVADLHLGYAWAQRRRGQLLPVSAPDDTVERLLDLQNCYSPEQIVLLGDVVHRAWAHPGVQQELARLCHGLSERSRLCWIAGNHDRGLQALLTKECASAVVTSELQLGPYLFLHGDEPNARAASALIKRMSECGGRIIIGHEHPAVNMGDGVTTSAKCPCFLVSETVLVLPAFSAWAAGTAVGRYDFLSALCKRARFSQAVAIVGSRLLPIPLAAR